MSAEEARALAREILWLYESVVKAVAREDAYNEVFKSRGLARRDAPDDA